MRVTLRRAVIAPLVIAAMTSLVPRGAAETRAEAATRIAEELATFPRDGDPSAKARLREELESAKRSVATLVVQVEADGLEVLVDGAWLGQSPLVRLLYVAPGEHEVVGRVHGQIVVSEVKRVEAAQSAMYRLRGKDEAAKPLWPGILLGGISAASIATGIGLLITSVGKSSDADELASDIAACDLDRLSRRCEELSAAVASRNALLDGATVAFVAGGIGAVATIGYVLIPLPTENIETSLSVGPGAVPLGFGLGLRGRF